jgi:hypothetical protein
MRPTTATTTTCARYFERLSSDLLSDVESPRTTFGEQKQHTNSLEVTQLYILEDESEINGSHSSFDLLNGID